MTMVSETRTNIRWVKDLRSGRRTTRDAALRDLSRYVQGGVARALGARGEVETSDLEDFTQEAIVRILGALDSFRGESRFTTWAMTIALRVAYTSLRKRRFADVSLEEIEEYAHVLGSASLDAANPVEREAERNDLLDALRRAIEERLTERQRTVVLAELRGVPSDRVAEILDSNRNAVYKVYHDARKNLRAALMEAGFTPSDVASFVTEEG